MGSETNFFSDPVLAEGRSLIVMSFHWPVEVSQDQCNLTFVSVTNQCNCIGFHETINDNGYDEPRWKIDATT